METSKGCFSQRRVLAPCSNRTLHHPTFMPLYMTPGQRDHQTVHPITTQEFFYIDPTMVCGARIPNHVNELKFDYMQLNTPPPIMSAFPAPPNRPDPFRSVQHLVRNLGSSPWEMGPSLSSVGPQLSVIQLTEEEDQAITNLLKLRHQEGTLSTGLMEEVSCAEEPLYVDYIDCPSMTPEPYLADEPLRSTSREAGFGKHWSDIELEAANTLFTQFSPKVEDKRDHADVSRCSNFSLSDVKQNSDLPLNERALSKSEGDALCVLLSLGTTQR